MSEAPQVDVDINTEATPAPEPEPQNDAAEQGTNTEDTDSE